jgi:hypothetical protein
VREPGPSLWKERDLSRVVIKELFKTRTTTKYVVFEAEFKSMIQYMIKNDWERLGKPEKIAVTSEPS